MTTAIEEIHQKGQEVEVEEEPTMGSLLQIFLVVAVGKI